MAWYKFKQIETDERGEHLALFIRVNYIDGILQPVSSETFKMRVTPPLPDFSANSYYEVLSEDRNHDNNLSSYGWRSVTPEEILAAENERIKTDLEQGRIPLGLNDQQEDHNKKALQALEDFMKRKKNR